MQVKVRIKCTNPKCEKGIIYDPHCTACGERISSDFCDSYMPCGHTARRYLVEEYDCPRCAGSGWEENWMDIEEVEEAIRNASKSISLSS